MIHEILPVGMLECNCSIFGDEESREAIVIDPGDNIDQILVLLAKHRLKVKAIVITHAHIDHIGGAAKLKAATGAAVHMNASDQELYDHLDVQAGWLRMKTPERTGIDAEARDGDTLDWEQGFSRAAYAGTHTGQHFAVDSGGAQADRGRHLVSRQHREDGFAGRRWAADPAVD